ncbi:MAG TPA: hypothetical protein VIM07_04800 [Chitinophagaceae bacterium]
MKIIFLLITILLVSCSEQTQSTNKLTHEDSLKNDLIGQWGGLGEDSPVWDFKKDSIYYYNRSASYPYRIINQDLIIYLPESKGILKNIRVVKDTLFFIDDQGLPVKGYRMNELPSKSIKSGFLKLVDSTEHK